jgi:hypothetical protein
VEVVSRIFKQKFKKKIFFRIYFISPDVVGFESLVKVYKVYHFFEFTLRKKNGFVTTM